MRQSGIEMPKTWTSSALSADARRRGGLVLAGCKPRVLLLLNQAQEMLLGRGDRKKGRQDYRGGGRNGERGVARRMVMLGVHSRDGAVCMRIGGNECQRDLEVQ